MGLAPGTRIGAYELVASLGAGGMGEVYRARDTRLERTVALKVLPPEFADPEARVEAVLATEIVKRTDVRVIEGCNRARFPLEPCVLVIELLEGETLAARLARGPLSLDDAIAVAQQIAGALDRAHRAGIVHRDLKPANVIVLRGGGRPTVKLLVFGLAKVSPTPVSGFGANTIPQRRHPRRPLRSQGSALFSERCTTCRRSRLRARMPTTGATSSRSDA